MLTYMSWKHWQRIFVKAAQSILSEKLYLEPKNIYKHFELLYCIINCITDIVKPQLRCLYTVRSNEGTRRFMVLLPPMSLISRLPLPLL